MNRQEIEKKVNEIIVDKLGVDITEVKETAKLEDDFGADSLDVLELAIAVEKEFGVTVSDEKFYQMSTYTVGDVYNLIEENV